MKYKFLYWVTGLSVFAIILVIMYATLLNNTAIGLSNGTEYDKSKGAIESGEYYALTAPAIDYSTTLYQQKSSLDSYEINMPLHTDKVMLAEVEKEKYLLNDSNKKFYFGINSIKQTRFSLIEIYPEDRDYPFYYYEFCSTDKSIIDNGIIDGSSGVTMKQSGDLIWLDFGYGSNDNYIRFFKVGSQFNISQLIHVPFGYEVYNDFYRDDGEKLLAYRDYDKDGELCIKIIDIFDNTALNQIIVRDFAELGTPQNILRLLNSKEIYIEYEWCDEGRENWKLIKEIINFESNLTVYYKEEEY